ncbi:MAG: hypothetical protein V7784_23435 [Oceanospirillaceae bacterium]
MKFKNTIHDVLQAKCGGCHNGGNALAFAALPISTPASLGEYNEVKDRTSLSDPANSLLLFKAIGLSHPSPLVNSGPDYDLILEWINDGVNYE